MVGPHANIQRQTQPYQSQNRPAPATQPSYLSGQPAANDEQLLTQRFGGQQATSYGTSAQRPQNLVSHKLPLNPKFNRTLLEQNDDSQQAHAVNSTAVSDLSALDLSEPHADAQYSSDVASPWNQPSDANYPATSAWQDEYAAGGYPGMYAAEENGGYRSLPRAAANRPQRPATGPPVQPPPPPPPPPDPCKLNAVFFLFFVQRRTVLVVHRFFTSLCRLLNNNARFGYILLGVN